jgi:hypothetical protein
MKEKCFITLIPGANVIKNLRHEVTKFCYKLERLSLASFSSLFSVRKLVNYGQKRLITLAPGGTCFPEIGRSWPKKLKIYLKNL